MSDGPSRDAFLGGRLHLWQPARGFRASTDAVLLAASVPAMSGQTVLDLGCGVGAVALCLGVRVQGVRLSGVELQADYAALAERNAVENGLQLDVHSGDISALPEPLRDRQFDHVVTNPPFFEATRASAGADNGRDRARRQHDVTLPDWVDAALKRTKPQGHVSLIHRTERLPEILSVLSGKSGDIAVLPLAARQMRPAERVIVQARKGSRGPLCLLPPFVLHEGDRHERDGAGFSKSAEAILRHAAALPVGPPVD